MNRVLLIRHGDTDMVGRQLAGRTPDVHLNPRGQIQARELAKRLHDIPLDAIYTSPLERARETALPLAQERGLESVALTQLQELDYGMWQGSNLPDLEGDPYWKAYNQCRSLYRIPGGESLMEAQIRMVQAVEWLRAEHVAANLMLVGHSDPIKALLMHMLGIPLDFVHRLDIMPASVSVVEFTSGHPHVRCINDLGDLPCLRAER